MYTISSIKPAGISWYEVVIEGPYNCSIPMKQRAGDKTIESVWTRAQDWCDNRNVDDGYVTLGESEKPKFGPSDKYRRAATVNYGWRKKLREELGD